MCCCRHSPTQLDHHSSVDVSGTQTESVPCKATLQGRPDVSDAADVVVLMRQFYARVARDDILDDVFYRVAHVDWAEHMTKLTGFWSRVLFGTTGYTGDPFSAHQRIHQLEPLTPAHFARWLALFHDSLDRKWCGPNVDKMKAVAETVARAHQERLAKPPTQSGRTSRKQKPMRTTLRIDNANCPNCFNDTVDQLTRLDGVRAVHGSMAVGTIDIDHDHVALDDLIGVVRDHLHGIEMFANEIRMVPLEPSLSPTICAHES